MEGGSAHTCVADKPRKPAGPAFKRAVLAAYRLNYPDFGPTLASEKLAERADVIVCGTPEILYDPVTEIVVALPAGRPDNATAPLPPNG